MKNTKTLLDEFAIAALPIAWQAYEYKSCYGKNQNICNKEIVECAYQIAEAMLKIKQKFNFI